MSSRPTHSASRPATILFYSHTGSVSGSEIILLNLIREIASRRPDATSPAYQMVLVCPQGEALWQQAGQIPGLQLEHIHLLEVGYVRNGLVVPGYLLQLVIISLQLARLIVRYRPALIHANSTRAGLIACLVGAVLRVKVLVHLHDLTRDGRADRLISGLFQRLAWRLVANSQATRQSFVGDNPVRQRKCLTIYNGVNTKEFDPRHIDRTTARARLLSEWPTPKPTECWPLIGLVGQITPWKGHQDALESLVALRQHFPQAGLLIVGGLKFVSKTARYDNATFRQNLDQYIADNSLEKAVWFAGERSQAAMEKIMGTLDVLIVPSWYEPFGRVIIEGMAMERPVVASRVEGPSEIIEDGQSGVLVPPKDSAALAEALIELASDPARMEELGKRARQRVIDQFSLGRMGDQFLAVYAEAVKPR